MGRDEQRERRRSPGPQAPVRRGRVGGPRLARRLRRHPARAVHRGHGAVGLGQVHADAPAGGPRPADRRHRRDRRRRTSRRWTTATSRDLRRRHVGFIFQFFNLLPMLTAEENMVLPLELAGTKADDGWVETLIEKVGLGDRRTHRPGRAVGRPAAARGHRARARLPPDGAVRRRADRQPRLEHRRGDPHPAARVGGRAGQTTVMVTHDAVAASIADRILFLADGHIVRDLGKSSEEEVLAAMKDLHHAMTRVVLRGHARAQAAHRADRVRRGPRRGDGERRLHPHRHAAQRRQRPRAGRLRGRRRGRESSRGLRRRHEQRLQRAQAGPGGAHRARARRPAGRRRAGRDPGRGPAHRARREDDRRQRRSDVRRRLRRLPAPCGRR